MQTDIKGLAKLIKEARHVYICGNGGSSATAEHFTNDLWTKGIKAFCLSSNVSIITKIANDFGYEYIYSKQLEIYANKEDLLITISGSGMSKNIVEAMKNKNVGIKFGIMGFDGGKVLKLSDYYILFKGTDYGEIEDKHMLVVHKVKNLLGEDRFKMRGGKPL
jgi:phosphoheptose isomerase